MELFSEIKEKLHSIEKYIYTHIYAYKYQK